MTPLTPEQLAERTADTRVRIDTVNLLKKEIRVVSSGCWFGERRADAAWLRRARERLRRESKQASALDVPHFHTGYDPIRKPHTTIQRGHGGGKAQWE